MSSHPLRRVRAAYAAGLLSVLVCAPTTQAQTAGAIVGGPPPAVNNPPAIVSIHSQQLPGKRYRIWGQVSDETPGTCGVVVTGAANGVAMCDMNGNFDAIYNVATPGAITAVPGDGVQSGQAVNHNLINNAPTCTVMAVQGPNNTWTFSGTVGDEAPGGLTIALSGPPGVNGATATALANGTWSVTVTVAPGTGGMVTATATDWYGLTGEGYTSFQS